MMWGRTSVPIRSSPPRDMADASFVYAIEPGFATYAQLCKNIHLNEFYDRIVPLPIALSDHTSVDVFNYSTLATGGALHSLGTPTHEGSRPFTPVFAQTVLAYRLDDLVRRFGLRPPTHLKIHVDGLEFKILQGANETLTSGSIRSLLVEIDEEDVNARPMIAFLAERGFDIASKHHCSAAGAPPQFATMYNYIFARRV